jgi:glycosyltransferase involved in cell wall biosynthesis
MLDIYLPRAHAMLVTSTKEGYGLIVLEGNAYGLPVIAYDVPGVCDSVRNGKNGFLITDADYKAM